MEGQMQPVLAIGSVIHGEACLLQPFRYERGYFMSSSTSTKSNRISSTRWESTLWSSLVPSKVVFLYTLWCSSNLRTRNLDPVRRSSQKEYIPRKELSAQTKERPALGNGKRNTHQT